MMRILLVCAPAAILLVVTAPAGGSEEFAARRPALGLPSSGAAITPAGSLDPTGATQMNIPVAYTLHHQQRHWGLYWGQEGERDDIGGLLSISVGRSPPGQGLSLTTLFMEHEGLTGAIQKQLWPESGKWPAIAAGIYDVADCVDRGGYVVATRRLGGQARSPLTVAWPPGELGAVSAADPRTWGQLIISPEQQTDDAPLHPARHLLEVPVIASPPRTDGVSGSDEWRGAAAQVYHFAPGEEMLLMAGHDDANLYICISVPSDHGFGPGYAAQLLFEVPQQGAAQLNNSHRRYAAQVGHGREVATSYTRGDQGRWLAQGLREQTGPRFSAAASDSGDGAWRWPVFEFAVPLADLKDSHGQCVVLGFAARMTLAAGSTYYGQKSTDVVRFPAGRNSYRSPYNHVFPIRPDLWGKAVFADSSPTNDTVSVSVTAEAIEVDGRLDEMAWQQATPTSYTVFGDSTQTIRTLADNQYLYLGVRCAINRGARMRRNCQIYLDPLADEGLLPRPDDLLFQLEAASGTAQCFQWQDEYWSQPQASRFKAAAHSARKHQQIIDTYEFAIPLRELNRPAPDAAVGLAVQTEYKARPCPRLVEQVPAKAYLTAGWGAGPFASHGFGGLSVRMGRSAQGIVEYDGEGLNLGYITKPASGNYSLMLGIRNFAGPRDSRLTIGLLCPQSQF